MQASEFDEQGFFTAIAQAGVRALLIGRRALVVLGAPVLTADYDFWIHADDIDKFNAAAAEFDLLPSHTAEEARGRGRYVLENGEHVDVLVARAQPTIDGERVFFDDIWTRRRSHGKSGIALPAIRDLMATKRFAARPKDAEDLRFLARLLTQEEP
jgi:hypothetical protein